MILLWFMYLKHDITMRNIHKCMILLWSMWLKHDITMINVHMHDITMVYVLKT